MNELLGRRRRSAREIEGLVGEFRASGLSVAAFARRAGVTPTTVRQWLRRFPTATAAAKPPLLAGALFVPVRVTPVSEALRLVRPDGWRIEFPRGLPAAEVQQLLQGLGGC